MNISNSDRKTDKKIAKIENKLEKSLKGNDKLTAALLFRDGFLYLLTIRNYDVLSAFILSHLFKTQIFYSIVKEKIPNIKSVDAVNELEKYNFDMAALILCDCLDLKAQTIYILAKRGRANDLALFIANESKPDKWIMGLTIDTWEKFNGNINKSPVLTQMIRSIGTLIPESLPENPSVKEIIGQYKEAAVLYERMHDLDNALKCYETAGIYEAAEKIYAELKNNEGVSRMAEARGDLEKALEYVVKPERRIDLLIRMEKFFEARNFAAGLEEPDTYFKMIYGKAKTLMNIKLRKNEYVEAMELAEISECDASQKEDILLEGRKYYAEQLRAVSSNEETKKVFRNRIKLEEKYGNFEEAGVIAEEILHDSELASLLYEKANLFNRAIQTISLSTKETYAKSNANIRLAQLHEKGGNLIKAAQLYEVSGNFEKAYVIYNNLQNYSKALDCYEKTENSDRNVLLDLYLKNNKFEKVIESYLKSNTFSDLEKALSIARTYNITTYINEINDRISRYQLENENNLKNYFSTSKEEVLSSYSPVLGIDFGTTNSIGALFNKKTKKVETVPVAGTDQKDFEPSFFGTDENNNVIVGEKARVYSLTAPERVVTRVKRSLGDGKSFHIGNKTFKSEEIIARIIQKIKVNAETYIKQKIHVRFRELLNKNELVYPEMRIEEFLNRQGYFNFQNVVLTVPAYFNDNQKRATKDSAEIAGLKVLRLLHEPTAAALAYGYQKSYTGNLAVIDLGGGTLDISILDVGEGVYQVQNVHGDIKLGGSDIDTALLDYVIDDIKKTFNITLTDKEYPVEINRLRDSCENLKISLSYQNSCTMELIHFLNKPKFSFMLTRKELESISQPVLNRIRVTVQKALKEYNGRIDHFLLVGNATKMPAVVELVKSIINAQYISGINPGTVVACGAALQGAILNGDLHKELLLDVVPYSLGISVLKKDAKTDEEEMSLLIERNTTIPVIASQDYTTTKDNQTSVHIKIYQGEYSEPQRNYFLGDFHLQGILPAPAGKPQIDVKFEIGVDCILTVTAKDRETKRQHSIKIENVASLSTSEKEELKKHFAETEDFDVVKEKAEKVRGDMDTLNEVFRKTVQKINQSMKDFIVLFQEKVEKNARFYKTTSKQAYIIQNMFFQKDQISYMLQKLNDEAHNINVNIEQLLKKHFDFTDKNIMGKMQERYEMLLRQKTSFQHIIASAESDIQNLLAEWMTVLKEMEPDISKMNTVNLANYYFAESKYDKAIDALEASIKSPEGLSREAFDLLLKCYIRLCLYEEYRDLHKKYDSCFRMVYPDFNRLDLYLNNVCNSVFMIYVNGKDGISTGSGFSILPNLIVTNRHVVEGAKAKDIKIIKKSAVIQPIKLDIDPVYDLAVLYVDDILEPFRLGEFESVSPGEQVITIGFPAPKSNSFSENIYISKGMVNSIRNYGELSDRVIYIDSKINSGMSGGPLINDLGEVIGIATFVEYEFRQTENETYTLGNQPVALPVDIVKKYLMNKKAFL